MRKRYKNACAQNLHPHCKFCEHAFLRYPACLFLDICIGHAAIQMELSPHRGELYSVFMYMHARANACMISCLNSCVSAWIPAYHVQWRESFPRRKSSTRLLYPTIGSYEGIVRADRCPAKSRKYASHSNRDRTHSDDQLLFHSGLPVRGGSRKEEFFFSNLP